MTKKPDWPEKGYLDSDPEVDPRVAEQTGLPALMRRMPTGELGRALRFDEWLKKARAWVDLLKDDSDINEGALADLITKAPMPLLVLQARFAIADSNVLIEKALQALRELPKSANGLPEMTQDNLKAAVRISRGAKNRLNQVLLEADQVQELTFDEKQMTLPPIPELFSEALIKINEGGLSKEFVEQVRQEAKDHIHRIAADTYALTFADIHGMSSSLYKMETFFNNSYKQFVSFYELFREMQKGGVEVESLNATLEFFDFEGKLQVFQEMNAHLQRLLEIFQWRMGNVNLPASDALASELHQEHILTIYKEVVRPMRERIKLLPESSASARAEVSRLEKLLARAYQEAGTFGGETE